VLTGVHAAGAITAALLRRERSGRGQLLDCSLLDAQVSGLANIASNWLVAGNEAQRWGTAHESIVPYQVFPTRDRPIAIAVANQKLWGLFCSEVGRPEWRDDPRFATNPKRVEHRHQLLPLVAEVLASRTCDEWMERFVAVSIPAGPVNNMEQLFSDPQVQHRDMALHVEHPTIGDLCLTGMPVKFSDTPGRISLPPPRLGEHTDDVLTGVLGYAPEQIASLRADQVI
jgi:crotonobetainyl-CoA:carnitine CoA-transferase CaiB-like acyl-CoA transferase